MHFGVKPLPVRAGLTTTRSETDRATFDIPCKRKDYSIDSEEEYLPHIRQVVPQAVSQLEEIKPKSLHPGLFGRVENNREEKSSQPDDLTIELTLPHVTVTQTACEFTQWGWTLNPFFWLVGGWNLIGELHTATVRTRLSFHGTVKDRNGHNLFDRAYDSEGEVLLTADWRLPDADDVVIGTALSKSFHTLLRNFVFDITDSVAIRVYARGKDPGVALAESEVDEVPMAARTPRDGAYAVIIGIEEYRLAEKASHARHDALVFAQYAQHVMGYAQDHTIVLTDGKASLSDMRKYLEEWLPNNVTESGSVLVYYAGHGVVDPKTGNEYLLPYGGDPNALATTGYPVARLYQTVGRLKTRGALLVLDTDFSGQGARSVRPKTEGTPKGSVVTVPGPPPHIAVLKATSGTQKSLLHPQERHSAFTYALLKTIREHVNGAQTERPTLQQFAHDVARLVQETAQRTYHTDQSPELMATKGIQGQSLLMGSAKLEP